MSSLSLPATPVPHKGLLAHLEKHVNSQPSDLFKPYRAFDASLRGLYAQEPGHEALKDHHVNVLSIYDGPMLKTRSRSLDSEDTKVTEQYLMPLADDKRRANESPAVIETIKEYKQNFSVFSELALADLDWRNVVVAGSAALTPLLPVPEKYKQSKRGLREYYHKELAPASDVDIFLYGLNELEAKEKIKQIYHQVKDAVLQEVTCIRTKNTITIASQYPTRHIQIVLRLYSSVSEILTGFDVDCSCVAFDGQKVWAAPRAVQALMTQINHVDLTRRSPSYENRLSKYSHRGFEICYPDLDRSRIDPTIFERSFQRTEGLARLLVLEKLPQASDRENYSNLRRKERGRPVINYWRKNLHKLRGNIKTDHEDEVADWLDQEDVSDYHTFTVPYGERWTAKRIEKVLYTKDLLLNAEWNRKKDRETTLHRHPAFFGNAEDVFQDCCGHCPEPVTDEDFVAAEEEDKIYVKGELTFQKDDPGRQTIGSFNPITDTDWTEMAYVGNTQALCEAIIENDLDYVQKWLKEDEADPNSRDYTGRTPLHLAVMCSSPDIVRSLVNARARLVARLADGRTSLHLAAQRGNTEIIKIILDKSEQNEEEHEEKETIKKEERRKARELGKQSREELIEEKSNSANTNDGESEEDEDWEDDEHESASMATGSFVKVGSDKKEATLDAAEATEEEEPDFYDVNVLAWDAPSSPLHLAILSGHIDAVKMLVGTFGADVLLPVKLLNDYDKSPRGAILTMVLALALPPKKAMEMAKALLDLHATSSQADMNGNTVLHYYANDSADAVGMLLENDTAAATAAAKHLAVSGSAWYPKTNSALLTAVARSDTIACLKLLECGAPIGVSFDDWIVHAAKAFENNYMFKDGTNRDAAQRAFRQSVEQPIIVAITNDSVDVALALLDRGADPNTVTRTTLEVLTDENVARNTQGSTALDLVEAKIKELKGYTGEKFTETEPLQLREDSLYLKDLEPGSYKHLIASTSLLYARKNYEDQKKRYDEKKAEFDSLKGVEEKKQGIERTLRLFEKLEAELKKRGAKSFKKLHSKVPQPSDPLPDSSNYPSNTAKPFEVSFGFRLGELTDTLKEQYLRLFEAAWQGDLETIKSLTLQAQGENKDKPPLKIAVQDDHNTSPLSIAVVRGHLDVAAAILQICLAQYKPKEETGDARYAMNDDYDTYDSEDDLDDDNNVYVYKSLVDERFTIDNIGEVSLQVKSHVTPSTFLHWACPSERFYDGGIIKRKSTSGSLLGCTIDIQDEEKVDWLLHAGAQYANVAASPKDVERANSFYKVEPYQLGSAVALENTAILSALLKETGSGIPLEDLAKQGGVKKEEKPKYYQGLSVYGRKRTDWAAAGRGMRNAIGTGSQLSPVLTAARHGSLSALEYMLSDSPLRLYLDFVTANKDDKTVARLIEGDVKIEKMLAEWYHGNDELLILSAVLSEPSETATKRLEYLIKSYPEHIDARTPTGETALMVAFKLGRHAAAKMLLDADADPEVRNKFGANLVHALLGGFARPHLEKLDDLKAMLDLLDKDLVATLMLQRSSADNSDVLYRNRYQPYQRNVVQMSGTPLHCFLHATLQGYGQDSIEKYCNVVKILLEYSHGKDLTIANSAGVTPLHTVLPSAAYGYALGKVLLDHTPSLLHHEDATGRTPYELAQDQFNAAKLSSAPTIKTAVESSRYFYYDPSRNINSTLVDLAPQFFIKKEATPSGIDATWTLCQEVAALNPDAKRRLVSLNEANEVSRRVVSLAKQSKGVNAAGWQDENRESEVEKLRKAREEAIAEWVGGAVAWKKDDEDFKNA